MDPFNIDMELLRRVGCIRQKLESLNPEDGRHELTLALQFAQERSGDIALVIRLLHLLEMGVGEADDELLTPTSKFATAASAALCGLEEFLINPDDPESEVVIGEGAATILLALGREESEWDHVVDGQDGDDVPDLDDLANLVVEFEIESREDLEQLLEHVRALSESDTLPEGHCRPLVWIIEGLEYALSGKRRTKKKVEAAEVAVERIGELIEEIMIEAEMSAPVTVDAPATQGTEGDEVEIEAEERADAKAEAGPKEPASEVAEAAGAEARRMPATAAAVPAIDTADVLPFEASGLPEVFNLPEGVDKELLSDFVSEGFDYLEQAEAALLALEKDPTDVEAVNVVFRAFHTVKGVAGFLELEHISELAHQAESLLSRVRDGDLRFSHSIADLTLKSADGLRDLLEGVRSGAEHGGAVHAPDGFTHLLEMLSDPSRIEAMANDDGTTALATASAEDGEAPSGEGASPKKRGAPAGGAPGAEGSVRVKTARLDRLLELVGEMVVAYAMVAEDPIVSADHQGMLARKINRSEKILRDLQDLAMAMRMVPLKPSFQKLSRVARDVSRRAKKPVQFVTEGEDTELDRNMVNTITDPLVHMVRNAIDHGIESAEERIAAGKPEQGLIQLTARQSGGNVVIEIIDDGRGLDRQRIAEKAIAKGLIDSDRGLSDTEVFELIFAPGFSTVEQVTDISGRGVGMDVVKRSVESLRGRVDIDSTLGKGSRFVINLPLTLAITDGMLLRVGSERYIIPMVKIQMSFRPATGDLYSVVGKGEMVTLHDDLLPIVRLHQVYGVPDAETDPAKAILIIAGEGSRRSAIMVDEILGQQQLVVKALSGSVANIPGVAGGAILGDGAVGLILDPDDLITLARSRPRSAA